MTESHVLFIASIGRFYQPNVDIFSSSLFPCLSAEMYSLSLALLLAAPCAFALPAVRGPRVHNSAGTVEGNQLDRVEEYLGMPFGNAKRYEAPVDFKGKYKNSFLETKYFGHACMQVGADPSKTYGSEGGWSNLLATQDETLDKKLNRKTFFSFS